MKRTMTGCAVALMLMLAGAGAAHAGEVNGNGDPTEGPGHAASECVYSGLDAADAVEGNPPGFDDDMLAMRGNQSPAGKDRYHGVQSFGIYASAGIDLGVNPGMACRGGGHAE
jgi:hypothetical protein